MSEFRVTRWLDTGTVAVKDVQCRGTCRHRSGEECSAATHLVFPYRGVYLRHVGREQSVGSSRVDLQACKLEYSIVSPK